MKKQYTEADVLDFNQRHLDKFHQTEVRNRLLFITDCLKPELAEKVKAYARRIGYREQNIFVVGGPTAVVSKLKEFNYPAFIGIACPSLILQTEKRLENVCAQAIPLTSFNCPIDRSPGASEVDAKEVVRILNL